MSYQRIFPRYDILKIKGKVWLGDLEQNQVILKDISLGGFKIFYPEEFQFKDYVPVKIQLLERESYNLNARQVWHMKSEVNNSWVAGFELQFDEKTKFEQWLKTIRAIHLVKQKIKN